MKSRRVFSSLSEEVNAGSRSKKRKKSIALVVTDIQGLVRSGGVAKANSAIADSLSSFGHKVTIVFVSRSKEVAKDFHFWQIYLAKRNIELLWLEEPKFELVAFDPVRLSYAAYLYLKSKTYDIVHFADVRGLAYFSLSAKALGIAFQNTLLCVNALSSRHWSLRGNLELPSTPTDLLFYYLERKSVELADVLISPTQYFINWILDQKWTIPKKSFVQTLPISSLSHNFNLKKRNCFREIVFFGRLETRKGIIEFCDALDEIGSALKSRYKICATFMGAHGSAKWNDSKVFITERSRKWSFDWKLLSDLNHEQALQYLAEHDVLAVMPSRDASMGLTVLECMSLGIPFLAADIAPFRELIAAQYHKKVLCDTRPKPFATRILNSLESGGYTAKPAINFRTNRSIWGAWYSLAEAPRLMKSVTPNRLPFVTVCLTHRDRPKLLQQSLDALAKQDYKNFEVLLLDDASEKTSSKRYLLSLKSQFKSLGWRIKIMKQQVGPIALRNLGAKMAYGSYLVFMDDDNIAKPNQLSTFVKCALFSKADILTCCFDRFSGPKRPDGKSLGRELFLGDVQSLNLWHNQLGDMNFCVKKCVYTALKGLKEKETGVGAEDAEFLARAAFKNYKLVVIPEALFWYRSHDSNYSSRIDGFETQMNRVDPYFHLFENLDMKQFMSYSMGAWYKFYNEHWAKGRLFPEIPKK